ncbi:symmetrical bis(5'-nucleosyl)-tetraphosphatase [Algiphilus sp.]|uniref:symmetrical bis(5'-nucleosyl)-tetraphosphatase n=1 Tax=Algiphilus sp. TaxID=1872431 RepID=UPI003B52CBA6
MTTWIIGDLQGCYDSLMRLLDQIAFESRSDELIFVGDLVNRGPGSEACLRWVQEQCERGSAQCVLGNHDLHLLAVAAGKRKANDGDTLDDILRARDRTSLLDWLARQPLLLRRGDDCIVHAGLHPDWDLDTATLCAREVEAELAGTQRTAFFARMYGNEPSRWRDCTSAEARQRFAVNSFTRMRFVHRKQHALMLKAKGSAESPPEGCIPWFAAPHHRPAQSRVFFGHWSTLGTVKWPQYRVLGLDTGCVWGNRLTACDLHSESLHSVPTAPGEGRTPEG